MKDAGKVTAFVQLIQQHELCINSHQAEPNHVIVNFLAGVEDKEVKVGDIIYVDNNPEFSRKVIQVMANGPSGYIYLCVPRVFGMFPPLN